MTSATPIAPRDGHYHERVDTDCGGHYAVSAWPADEVMGHSLRPDIRIYAQEGGDYTSRELALHRVTADEARKLAAVLLAAAEVADPTPPEPPRAAGYVEFERDTLGCFTETVNTRLRAMAAKRALAAEVVRLSVRCGHCGELADHFGCQPDPKHAGYWICYNASDS